MAQETFSIGERLLNVGGLIQAFKNKYYYILTVQFSMVYGNAVWTLMKF